VALIAFGAIAGMRFLATGLNNAFSDIAKPSTLPSANVPMNSRVNIEPTTLVHFRLDAVPVLFDSSLKANSSADDRRRQTSVVLE